MDLLDVLDANKRVNAGDMLDALNVNVMASTTDAEGFREFANGLQRIASGEKSFKPATFDEQGFNQLKDQMTRGG